MKTVLIISASVIILIFVVIAARYIRNRTEETQDEIVASEPDATINMHFDLIGMEIQKGSLIRKK